MSRNLNNFTQLVPQVGTITIAGQQKLLITGQGTVHMSYMLLDSLTKITTLINVLYSKELQQTRLFSQLYICSKGFKLTARRDNLFLINQDRSYAMWAKYRASVMEIQTIESYPTLTANFVSYQEFYHAISYFTVLINLHYLY